MKHFIAFCALLSFATGQLHTHDEQAKKASLQIIAALSEDIADIVINARHAKDPQIAKATSISLITHMAEIIAAVLIAIKERKASRSTQIYSEEMYQQDLAQIISEILEKIEVEEFYN